MGNYLDVVTRKFTDAATDEERREVVRRAIQRYHGYFDYCERICLRADRTRVETFRLRFHHIAERQLEDHFAMGMILHDLGGLARDLWEANVQSTGRHRFGEDPMYPGAWSLDA